MTFRKEDKKVIIYISLVDLNHCINLNHDILKKINNPVTKVPSAENYNEKEMHTCIENLRGASRLFACFLPLALEHQAVTKKTASKKNTKARPTAEVKMTKEFLCVKKEQR